MTSQNRSNIQRQAICEPRVTTPAHRATGLHRRPLLLMKTDFAVLLIARNSI